MTELDKLRQQREDLDRQIADEERRQVDERRQRLTTSPDRFAYQGVAPINDYGDLSILLATKSGEQLIVEMTRTEVRGLFEALQRELSQIPQRSRTRREEERLHR